MSYKTLSLREDSAETKCFGAAARATTTIVANDLMLEIPVPRLNRCSI